MTVKDSAAEDQNIIANTTFTTNMLRKQDQDPTLILSFFFTSFLRFSSAFCSHFSHNQSFKQ
jgi:hypothetical protein